MNQPRLVNPFMPIEERIKLEREGRKLYQSNILKFGVTYLDDCLGGIFPNDLIIITAKTGLGKTELATIIAQENAMTGRKVHYFPLEAEPQEIERRMKFKLLSDFFYGQENWRGELLKPNYMDWLMGKQANILDQFEAGVDDQMMSLMRNFYTRYRTTKFGIEDFKRDVQLVAQDTDLIIIDHLHYFDLEDDNENRELKTIVKSVRDIALLIGKPVILLAHVRKSTGKIKTLIPDAEDIMGTSDIPKIATKSISLAPAMDQEPTSPEERKFVFPTYFKITKCRPESARTRWVGLTFYNTRINRYEDRYLLGKLNIEGDEFQNLTDWDYPHWARKPSHAEAVKHSQMNLES